MGEKKQQRYARKAVGRRLNAFIEAVKERHQIDDTAVYKKLGLACSGHLGDFVSGEMPLTGELIMKLHKTFGLNEIFLYREKEENVPMFVDRELEIIFNIIMAYEESKREKYKKLLKIMELPAFEDQVLGFISRLEIDYKKLAAHNSDKDIL